MNSSHMPERGKNAFTWARPTLAILVATAFLAFWTQFVRSANEATISWENLDEFGLNPYYLGLAAQELALPVFMLFLFSRTQLFERVVHGTISQLDYYRLLITLLGIEAFFFMALYGSIIVEESQATIGIFVVFVAGLLGGWQIGLFLGFVAMLASGMAEYLAWDKPDPFVIYAYLQYYVIQHTEGVALPWVGLMVGALAEVAPPRWRFRLLFTVGLSLLIEFGVAAAVFFSYQDSTFYFDRLLPNLLISGLTIAALTLVVRNVQAEVARRRAESTQLELTQANLTLAQTRLALVQAEVRALHAQINPHFFFNSLNTIRYFIRTDPGVARDLLTKLSEIFQRTLSAGHYVSLREEIEHVEAYLALEKARLDERLQVIWTNLAKDQLNAQVPTLILQPIVENAIIHGISPKTEGGTVHIVINKVGEELLLQVDDNGVGFDRTQMENPPQEDAAPNGEGRIAIGLRNVDDRLRMLYGADHRLLIESEPGNGTRVILRIPLHAQPAV